MSRTTFLLVVALFYGCGTEPPKPGEDQSTHGATYPGVGERLTVFYGDIIITSPADIERLHGYRVVRGNIFINPLGIADLRGLDSLHTIDGTLDIAYDLTQRQSLKSLEGLDSLEQVAGYVQIENCDLLEHLGGLERLREVGGSLSVYNNARLSSVEALGGLQHVELNFNILNNPYLPCDEAEMLVSELGESVVGGEVSVLNNGEEVGASCP